MKRITPCMLLRSWGKSTAQIAEKEEQGVFPPMLYPFIIVVHCIGRVGEPETKATSNKQVKLNQFILREGNFHYFLRENCKTVSANVFAL